MSNDVGSWSAIEVHAKPEYSGQKCTIPIGSWIYQHDHV